MWHAKLSTGAGKVLGMLEIENRYQFKCYIGPVQVSANLLANGPLLYLNKVCLQEYLANASTLH
jgi:hypothetical protein